VARWEVPADLRPLVNELKRLIQPGIAGWASVETPSLGQLAGGRGVDVGQLVRGAIAGLQGESRRKAGALFGVGKYQGVAASTRRTTAAQLHGVEGWNEYRHQPLHRLLVEVATALISPSGGRARLQRARPAEPVVGGDYELELLEVLQNVPFGKGLQKTVLEHRILRARRDGIKSWKGSHSSDPEAASLRMLPSVEHFGDGRLIRTRDDRERSLSFLEVRFVRPLMRDDTAEFWLFKSAVVEVDYDGLCYYSLTPVVPIVDFRVSLSFTVRPGAAWRMEGVQRYERPGKKEECRASKINEQLYCSERFTHLTQGLCYGIGWD
jgi:hypothetical protein